MSEFFLIFGIITFISVFIFYSNNVITVGSVLSVQMSYLSCFLLSVVLLLYSNTCFIEVLAVNSSFVRTPLAVFIAILATIGSICVCILALSYLSKNSLYEYEFILLILLVLVGSYCLVFSNDFLGLYLGVELQSLGLYILATMKTNSTFSTEAGLKYFVLGAFASSLLIFGIALFYGTTGLYNFGDISIFNMYNNNNVNGISNLDIQLGVTISLLFILASLLFKVGSAPFHMWVPDVYEGVPTIVTNFFALIPKLGVFSVLIRFLNDIYTGYLGDVSNILLYSGILSVFIGSVGAIGQSNIKRVISYSAISHTGFLIFGLSLGTFESFVGVLFYLFIYFTLTLSMFSSLLGMQQVSTGSIIKLVGNLVFVYKTNFWLAISLVFTLFSIAGVPPLSGFFSKFFIFVAGIEANYFIVSTIIILLSVVSSVYYLRLIRATLFAENKRNWLLFEGVRVGNAYIISTLLIFNVSFVFVGSVFLHYVLNLTLLFSV